MVARIIVGKIRGTPCDVVHTLLRRDLSTKGVTGGYRSSWISSLSSSRCPGLANVQLNFPGNLECTRGRSIVLYREGSMRTSSDFAGSKCNGRSDRDCRRAFSSAKPHPAVEDKDRPSSNTELVSPCDKDGDTLSSCLESLSGRFRRIAQAKSYMCRRGHVGRS